MRGKCLLCILYRTSEKITIVYKVITAIYLYIIELAKLFDVSTDYLLGMDRGAAVSVDGLSDKEVSVLLDLISCFRDKTKNDQ